MNTSKLTLRLAAAAAVALLTSVGFVACGGDDSTAGPTIDVDSGTHDTGSTQDTGNSTDGNNNDVGNCVSDASNCNSCVTPQQDRYNACSQYAVNCIPFDNSTVPQHPSL
jgi:hypothetical protein